MKTTDDIIKQRAKTLFHETLSEKLKSMDWKLWHIFEMMQVHIPKTGKTFNKLDREKANEYRRQSGPEGKRRPL